MPDRAILFIDGNNWYHSMGNIGVGDRLILDYRAISEKLVGPARDWVGTRYYIGRVSQESNRQFYADQRRFLASLQATDARITTHLGRLERRPANNQAVLELRQYLGNLAVRIDSQVYHDLMQITTNHHLPYVYVEKAVDVMLAVEMVVMAERDEYDSAYLLSADGDFTPAVEAVSACGKKVYAASPGPGAKLGAVVDSYIHLDRAWFSDCYKSQGGP